MVALVQTASTLPMFLLGLPSGALADIVDRRRYFAGTQLWVAAIALVLMALSLAGALSAPLLLLLTFLNGIALAMRWPVFAAIVPGLVPRAQLSSALALNGVAMNMSRIVGPAIAGALLASIGSAVVFALNALISVAAFVDHPALEVRAQGECAARRTLRRRDARGPAIRAAGAAPAGGAACASSCSCCRSSGLMALLPLLAKQLPDGGAGAFSAAAGGHRPRRGGDGGVHAAAARALRPRPLGARRHAGARGRCRWRRAGRPSLWLALPCMVVAGAGVDPDRQLAHRGRAAGAARLGARARHGALPDGADGRRRGRRCDLGPGGRSVCSVRGTVLAAAAFGVVSVLVTRRLSVERAQPRRPAAGARPDAARRPRSPSTPTTAR